MCIVVANAITSSGENFVRAEAERVAADAAAMRAAAESDVETDLGTETEAGTESELDTDADEVGGVRRQRAHRAELQHRMDVVDECQADDAGEQDEEESAEVLAASAAEDALYRVADEATRAEPSPPVHGQWAVESLDQDDEGLSDYRERQLQASALRDALAAAKAAKATQASGTGGVRNSFQCERM